MKHHIKRFQLAVHHYFREIIIGAVILLIILVSAGAMALVGNQNKLLEQVKTLSKLGNQLNKDNKVLNVRTVKLGEQNQSIAKQTRSFTTCDFKLFAKWTRDRLPIEDFNLDTCTVTSQTQATSDTTVAGTTPSGGPARPTTAPQSTPVENKPTPDNSSQPSPQPKPLNCKIDLLMIHIGCP